MVYAVAAILLPAKTDMVCCELLEGSYCFCRLLPIDPIMVSEVSAENAASNLILLDCTS